MNAYMGGTHQNSGIPASHFIKSKAEIHSYADCFAFLGNANSKEVASNVTIVRRSSTSIAVRLYSTDIVTYHDDGTFEADNGGYNTKTTTTRLNQFGPLGWNFGHRDFKLWGNGRLMGKGNHYRYPVALPAK